MGLLLLSLAGSGPGQTAQSEEPAPAWSAVLEHALDYLATTPAEFGLDVAVAVQIVGDLTSNPRAVRIVADRRPGLRPRDLERYGVLFDVPKDIYPPSSLPPLDVPPPAPPPGQEPDGLAVECPVEALQCRIDQRCQEFIERDDRVGYDVTHQAVWLLFTRWAGCIPRVDLEERRRAVAAALLAELQADHAFSDLFAERLAMLGHLGFAAEIRPEWIDLALRAQRKSGCWPMGEGRPCHPHPTAVTLWALALAHEAGRWPTRQALP